MADVTDTVYGKHNSSTYTNDALCYMPSDHRFPYRSISDHMYNAGNAHDNNEPNFKWCVCPVKTQITFGIYQMGLEPLLPTRKTLSPRVPNESKAMILIIYCWMNAQADLSHRYMSSIVRKPVFGFPNMCVTTTCQSDSFEDER